MNILEGHDTATEELDIPGRVPVLGFRDDKDIYFELGEELLACIFLNMIDGASVGCSNAERAMKEAAFGNISRSWILFYYIEMREVGQHMWRIR